MLSLHRPCKPAFVLHARSEPSQSTLVIEYIVQVLLNFLNMNKGGRALCSPVPGQCYYCKLHKGLKIRKETLISVMWLHFIFSDAVFKEINQSVTPRQTPAERN